MAACAAARAGTLSAKIGIVPFVRVRLDFTGTGVAELGDLRLSTLAESVDDGGAAPIVWKHNVFVGEHWLAGRFRIDLDPDRPSVGTLSSFRESAGITTALNRNAFNFVFRFQRVPGMAFTTREAVVNEAEVTGIPPEGSTYRVPLDNRQVHFGRKGESVPALTTLDFDFCEVTVFPERNIDVEILSVNVSGAKADVRIRMLNKTASRVRCTYFVVDHEADVRIEGDARFLWIDPNGSAERSFHVISDKQGASYDLPLYVGVYKPASLRGSKSASIKVTF